MTDILILKWQGLEFIWLVPILWFTATGVLLLTKTAGFKKPAKWVFDNFLFYLIVSFRVIIYTISKMAGKILIAIAAIYLVSRFQKAFPLLKFNGNSTLGEEFISLFLDKPLTIIVDIFQFIFLGEIGFLSLEKEMLSYIIVVIYAITIWSIIYFQIESYGNSLKIKRLEKNE